MKTILVLTYCISPYKGSEFSVSFNYINEMSKNNRLLVLYGDGKIDIEKYLLTNNLPNVEFINIKPYELNWTPAIHKLINDYRYKLWHHCVYNFVESNKNIFNEIDIIHYLNPIGFKEPGFLWKIDKPFIWGPIQGVENRPFPLYKSLSFKGKIESFARWFIHNALLIFNVRVRRTINKANVIFSATPKTKKQLNNIFNKTSIYLPENGILNMCRDYSITSEGGTLNLVWVGSIDERKALGILLDSLEKIKNESFMLDVVGTGPKLETLQQFTKKNGFNHRIRWHGQVTRDSVLEIFKKSHLHIITSLGEGTPTVLWEAMSNAIPTLSLDHCGMSGVICEKCGIKIPIYSYSQVVNDIAEHINNLIKNPSIINKLSEGVLECSKQFMWDKKRMKKFDEAYEAAIDNFQNR